MGRYRRWEFQNGKPDTPVFSEVLILRDIKVAFFHADLQVFFLKYLGEDFFGPEEWVR